jgi:GntR family transcriptional regulator/MocR family aminotransferase
LDNAYFQVFKQDCSIAENLISEAKNYLQMLTAKDLTQEQMLSELIYEGEIHRLLKKNILKRFFYTNVLKKILKSYLVLKTNGWLAIWLSLP